MGGYIKSIFNVRQGNRHIEFKNKPVISGGS
jgi:hypothetical protein